MQFLNLLSGGTPVIKKYKAAAGHAAGIVLLAPASNATGVSTSTTTSFANAVGLSLDGNLSAGAPNTYSTTQGDPEYLQSVIINPDAVLRILMVSGATGTALENRTVGSAVSNGLTVVGTAGDTDPSSPDMDEGTVWFTSGSNASVSRRITSTTTTLTVTVIVPFPFASVVGQRYCTVPYSQGLSGALITLTTDLKKVRAELAPTTGLMGIVDLELNGIADSYLNTVLIDHAFASS